MNEKYVSNVIVYSIKSDFMPAKKKEKKKSKAYAIRHDTWNEAN